MPGIRPVRVTLEGAAPSVALRAMAIGAASTATARITVVGSDRVLPSSANTFTVSSGDLTWSFPDRKSDYLAKRDAMRSAAGADAVEIVSSVATTVEATTGPWLFQGYDTGGRTPYPPDQLYESDGALDPASVESADLAALFARKTGNIRMTQLAVALSASALARLDLSASPGPELSPKREPMGTGTVSCADYTCPPPQQMFGDPVAPNDAAPAAAPAADGGGCTAAPRATPAPVLVAAAALGILRLIRRRAGRKLA